MAAERGVTGAIDEAVDITGCECGCKVGSASPEDTVNDFAAESRLCDGVVGWCEKAVTDGGREPGVDPELTSEDVDLEAWDDEPATKFETEDVDFRDECFGRDEARTSLEWG